MPMRQMVAAARTTETPIQHDPRLAAMKQRDAVARTTETPVQHDTSLAAKRQRNAATRATENPTQHEVRLATMRQTGVAARAMETPVQHNTRLAAMRQRNAAERATDNPIQREVRLATMREMGVAERATETPVQHDTRLAAMRQRDAVAKTTENPTLCEARLAPMRQIVAVAGATDTPVQCDTRLAAMRMRELETRMLPWLEKINSHFNYNATLKYENDRNAEKMNVICQHCRALNFKGKMAGLYCSNGKVDFLLLPVLPESLQSLLSGTSADSKHFLKFILTYNSCFQMTIIGCQERNLVEWMPTFRLQGEVYHGIGSLFPPASDDAKFLQTYFLSSQEQVYHRCTISDNLRPEIVLAL